MVLAAIDGSLSAVRDALRENPDGVSETIADANRARFSIACLAKARRRRRWRTSIEYGRTSRPGAG